jgi:hypothetical protein
MKEKYYKTFDITQPYGTEYVGTTLTSQLFSPPECRVLGYFLAARDVRS